MMQTLLVYQSSNQQLRARHQSNGHEPALQERGWGVSCGWFARSNVDDPTEGLLIGIDLN
jgi:hypothetical protein